MKFLSAVCVCLALAAAAPASFAAAQPRADDAPIILRQVILTRHGVRAPTQPAQTLESWSARPWPAWPVDRARLTPRGAELVRAFWAARRGEMTAQGLLPADRCPKEGELSVRADVDQRTRATAEALLEGLAPGCGLRWQSSDTGADPLFNAVRAKKARYSQEALGAAVTPEKLDQLKAEHAEDLALLQEITGCCAPSLCKAYGIDSPCALADLPMSLAVSRKGRSANIRGSMGVAASAAEILLLEFAQWPERNAGWGMVDETVLRRLLDAHTATFSLLNRSLPAAMARGSILLSAIRGRLLDEAAPRLTVYVGHDTNLANIGGLLGLEWQLPGYPPNATPPGTALIFSLCRLPNDSQRIDVSLSAYSLAALHAPDPSALPPEASLTVQAGFPSCKTPCTPYAFSLLVDDILTTK